MFLTARAIKFMGLALCAFSINGCATPSQTYWDAKVKELCEKDGGVTVFEHVEISKGDYPNIKLTTSGSVILPDVSFAKPDDQFYILYAADTVINDSPRVSRTESSIVRRSDNKILGKNVEYSRVGGDITNGISHSSHYSCSDVTGVNLNLPNSVFHIKGEWK